MDEVFSNEVEQFPELFWLKWIRFDQDRLANVWELGKMFRKMLVW